VIAHFKGISMNINFIITLNAWDQIWAGIFTWALLINRGHQDPHSLKWSLWPQKRDSDNKWYVISKIFIKSIDDLSPDIRFASDKWTAINFDWRMSEKLENACIFTVNDR
jgi:hypothetical protein